MDTNIIERNESCCSGSITQTEDKYIKSRSEIIDGIVYNINSVFDMTSKSTAEDKLICNLNRFDRVRIMDGKRG